MNEAHPSANAPHLSPAPADECQLLLTFLRDRNVSCPRCGYNLRDLSRPTCPECGVPLTLAVGTPRLRFGLFLATVTPGLFSGVAAVIMAIPMLFFPDAPLEAYLINLFGFASGASALLLYRFRAWFLRLPARQQFIGALLVWTVHIILFCFVLVPFL